MRVDGSANPTMPKNPAQYITGIGIDTCHLKCINTNRRTY